MSSHSSRIRTTTWFMSPLGLAAARILDLTRSSEMPRCRQTSSNFSSQFGLPYTQFQATAAFRRRRLRVLGVRSLHLPLAWTASQQHSSLVFARMETINAFQWSSGDSKMTSPANSGCAFRNIAQGPRSDPFEESPR